MAYLLDTNTLIQAKNEYYGFDICPGFWDWIDRESATGNVFSLKPVLDEIKDGDDELTEWATQRSESLFRPVDEDTLTKMPEVAECVQASDFRQDAKTKFLEREADPILIAYALAHPGIILASHEVHIEGERKKVKIPTICTKLGVDCIRTFNMLRTCSARFGLS